MRRIAIIGLGIATVGLGIGLILWYGLPRFLSEGELRSGFSREPLDVAVVISPATVSAMNAMCSGTNPHNVFSETIRHQLFAEKVLVKIESGTKIRVSSITYSAEIEIVEGPWKGRRALACASSIVLYHSLL